MTAKDIIDQLGGVTELSRQLGIPLTTVSSWGLKNSIPAWRQPTLLELAAKRGEALSTADFPVRAA